MRSLALVLVLLCAGCSNKNPVAPSTAVPTTQLPSAPQRIILAGGDIYTGPLHHNIPLTLPFRVDGVEYGFMCETKPRRYTLPNGTVEYTLDHYLVLGMDGCPDDPID